MTGGRVLLASPRSFCAGVDRAIEIVERLLDEHGPPVYVRHQIVHNDHVVGRLERLGAVFVDHEDEIPAGEICVLSAHGVAPDVKARCEERGLRVVDAVCPLVSKVHAEARRYADSGHLVALVGHADHVEVIGTLGERPDSTVVIESPEDALALEADGKPVAVITQTTLSLDDVAPIVVALETRLGALTRPAADDICYATQNRQDAVKRLVEEATLILVIGSTTSSNARRLVEVARAAGAEAALIDGESDLDLAILNGHTTVGVTGGASTPEELVTAVIARLADAGYDDLEEITVAREDVHFRLRGGRVTLTTLAAATCAGRSPAPVRLPPLAARCSPAVSILSPPASHREHAQGAIVTSVEVPYSIACALPTLAVLDITNDVAREVAAQPAEHGIVYVTATSTPWLVRVNERETGFFHDVEEMLTRLVPLTTPERERLLLALLGPRTEQLPFVEHRLCLGQWQRILLVGFNGTAGEYEITIVG